MITGKLIRYSMGRPLCDVDAEIFTPFTLGDSYLIFRISLNGDGDCRAVADCLIARQVNTCDIDGSDFVF